MLSKRIIPLVLVAFLAGCSSTYDDPIKVTSQFNPDVVYGAYRTWNFSKNWQPPQTGVLSDASFRLELANMIEDALKQQYNLVRVFENPDLEVGVYVTAEQVTDDELKKWYTTGDWNMPKYWEDNQDEWQAGTLMLMVFDSKTGQMIWRSSAEAIVSTSTPEDERREVVKRAVTMMLEKLPREKAEAQGGK